MSPLQHSSYKKADHQFADLRTTLSKYFYHWPLFLIFMAVACAGAYAYMKFTNPVYEINASILVKDEKKAPQEKAAMQELDQAGTPKNAEAEIQILKSKNLVKRVVTDLDLWTSYKMKEGLKTIDLYEAPPFKFLLIKQIGEELKPQELEILVKSKNSFEIQNLGNGKQTASFNKMLKNRFGRWMLKPTEVTDQYIGSTIKVFIDDPEKVSNAYMKSLDARLLDKAAPTIGLAISDEVPKRGKDFLNYLIRDYNEATSEEQKRTTKSTIDFIDKRLASLTGELSNAERQVEGYRSSQGITDINSQSKVYLENVQTNDIKMNEVNVQLNVINGIERYVSSSASGASVPATIGITDPTLNSLIEKLSQLQLKREALLATTPESNPAFEPIDRQISIAKSAIKQTVWGH